MFPKIVTHKRIRQALTSLVRVDICYENILLTSSDLLQANGPPPTKNYRICEIETLDGPLTANAPRYQVGRAFHRYIDGNHCVKVIDFGKNYTPGVYYGIPISFNYKAPAVIFSSEFSPSADIWNLGCTVLSPCKSKIFEPQLTLSERYSR